MFSVFFHPSKRLRAAAAACLLGVIGVVAGQPLAPVDPLPDDVPRAALRRGDAAPAAPTGFDPGHGEHGAALHETDQCPGRDVCYTLNIEYVTGQIRNPNFPIDDPRGHDLVKLRGYVGDVVDAAGEPRSQIEFVAPQVELRPGDTFRLKLNNRLARAEDMNLPWFEQPCATSAPSHNGPHCANFNLTNMHSHGLWVSPQGNSDNVLLTINPGVAFEYEYNIPEDHPAGTFWYHSHRHGSTAPQVASGMAGTLIIRGDRAPQLQAGDWAVPGDLDVLLPRPGEGEAGPGPRFAERVMLFQQIIYACRNADGSILRETPDGAWQCDPAEAGTDPLDARPLVRTDVQSEAAFAQAQEAARRGTIGTIDPTRVGTVEPGPTDAFDLLAFNAWPQSRRHTAINGTVQKVFSEASAGSVERWRLIDAGVRQTIRLQIRKAASPDAAAQLLAQGQPEGAGEAELIEVCSGEPLEVVGVATDGLTRPQLQPQTDTWLQPGYREDILVSFPEPGTYCLFNAAAAAADSINAIEANPSVLGLVSVTGAAVPGESGAHILAELKRSAGYVPAFADEGVRERILADLDDGGRLSAFVWHRSIDAGELTGRQTLGFAFAPAQGIFAIGEIGQDFLSGGGLSVVNAQPHAASRIDRLLRLGDREEWLLMSAAAGHPFHIHVNPFEIVEVLQYQPDARNPGIDPLNPATWVDVSVPGSGTEYAGYKHTWRDTVFVQPGALVRVRTHYQRYIGDFVLHCHILDHEDQGMMQNVRIALDDGRGGFDQPGLDHDH